jgi:hypothetical protein
MPMPITPNSHPISIDKVRFKVVPDLPEHDVVYSLATGIDGKIYLGVSSEFGGAVHAHFAGSDPPDDRVENLCRMYPYCGTRFANLNPETDEIYAVSFPTTQPPVPRWTAPPPRTLPRAHPRPGRSRCSRWP